MSAKFGKISVGCFIAFIIAMAIVYANVIPTPKGSCPAGNPSILVFYLAQLLIPVGMILGIIGAVKRESPKAFYLAGLLLHVGYMLFAWHQGINLFGLFCP